MPSDLDAAPAAEPQIQAPAAPPADTPAAPAEPSLTDGLKPLAEMTRDERAYWELHGTLPATEPATADPEPEPASTGPDIARFIRTPPPTGVSKRQHERNELIRFATEAEQRLQALEPPARAAAAPATRETPPAYDGLDPADPEPAQSAYDAADSKFAAAPDPYGASLIAYARDVAKWEARRDGRIAQHQEAIRAAAREFQTREQGWGDRRRAFAAAHPEFETAAKPALDQLFPDTPIGDVVMDSPIGPQIALHLATHPADLTRISGLHWRDQLREIGKLEAQIDAAVPAAPAAAAPPKTTVPTAPPPPTTLGTRPAEPSDPSAAALARGDVRAFMEAENHRDLARRRAGI